MLRRIGLLVLVALAVIGAVALTGVVAVTIIAARFGGAEDGPALPEQMIAVLDLSGAVRDEAPDPFAALFGGDRLRLGALTAALDRAEKDSRVKGLYLHVGAAGLSVAVAQELRDGLIRLRDAGKPCVAFAESFGELGTGSSGGYLLASACTEIWLQPSGELSLSGIAIEQPYLKAALGSIGIRFEVEKRAEFKSALDGVAEDRMSVEERTQLGALVDGWRAQMLAAIAAGRGLEPAALTATLAAGPLAAEAALAAKLVDRVGYRDEVLAALKARFGADGTRVALLRLLGADDAEGEARNGDGAARIAVLHAIGPILSGGGDDDPFADEAIVSADSFSRDLRRAAADPEIDGIIMRIDSPGGSYVASDTIRRAVELAKKEKPVIASMGTVAASGGYFIAMDADEIVAQPGTVTGSIGVIAGKPVLERLWSDVKLRWEAVSAGPQAGMWSVNRGFTPDERAILSRGLDRIYGDFVAKAAAARGMPVAVMEPLARGRVWTGADALAKGLVDQLGGIDAAVAALRLRLALDDQAPVDLVDWPPARSPFEELQDVIFGAEEEDGDELAAGAAPASSSARALRLLTGLAPAHPRSAELAALAALAEVMAPALVPLMALRAAGNSGTGPLLLAPSLTPKE